MVKNAWETAFRPEFGHFGLLEAQELEVVVGSFKSSRVDDWKLLSEPNPKISGDEEMATSRNAY